MSQEMKKDLHTFTTNLMDSVDALKAMGTNQNLVDLLLRAVNVGNIAILYFSSLSDEELGNVVSALDIASSIANSKEPTLVEGRSDDLARVVDAIEGLFRSKKLLLDGLGEKSLV